MARLNGLCLWYAMTRISWLKSVCWRQMCVRLIFCCNISIRHCFAITQDLRLKSCWFYAISWVYWVWVWAVKIIQRRKIMRCWRKKSKDDPTKRCCKRCCCAQCSRRYMKGIMQGILVWRMSIMRILLRLFAVILIWWCIVRLRRYCNKKRMRLNRGKKREYILRLRNAVPMKPVVMWKIGWKRIICAIKWARCLMAKSRG